jgi:hypothetical protein
MSHRLVSSACAATLVLSVVGLFGHGSAGASSAEAVERIEAMREAPRTLRFSGVVQVTWLDEGKQNELTVDVTGDMGAIEVQSGESLVFDRGTRTYFRNKLGWSSALIEPEKSAAPAPDHRWTLSERRGPKIAGRPTVLVEATRRNGDVAQRLFLDDETSLLLRRQVLDTDGRVHRSLEFLDLDLATTEPLRVPRGVSTRDAKPLDHVPTGYEAPSRVAGYVLVTRSQHRDGVELLYSDGLFSVSVFEQRGKLDWDALPARGVSATVDGSDARRYSTASADVVMWEHDGTVFTVVSDAPRDVVDELLENLKPDRSTVERVVDYVLGPFGWS